MPRPRATAISWVQVLFAYMNLLKTISMKLTVNLVNMFFHVDKDGAAFPLYTEAVKFIAHKCAPCSASSVRVTGSTAE